MARRVRFDQFAAGAKGDPLRDSVIAVSRLAIGGQEGMQHLYNSIVDRGLETGNLPEGTRVRNAMLAQLADVAAAFGTNNLFGVEPETQNRCADIAALCDRFSRLIIPRLSEAPLGPSVKNPTLLDRVEEMLNSIFAMPDEEAKVKRRELVALQANRVPIFILGAYKGQGYRGVCAEAQSLLDNLLHLLPRC